MAIKGLMHKQLEMHGWMISTVVADVLELKYQAINIHSADLVFIVLPDIHTKSSYLLQITWVTKITHWKKMTWLLG